jgi:hypothetical protein
VDGRLGDQEGGSKGLVDRMQEQPELHCWQGSMAVVYISDSLAGLSFLAGIPLSLSQMGWKVAFSSKAGETVFIDGGPVDGH